MMLISSVGLQSLSASIINRVIRVIIRVIRAVFIYREAHADIEVIPSGSASAAVLDGMALMPHRLTLYWWFVMSDSSWK